MQTENDKMKSTTVEYKMSLKSTFNNSEQDCRELEKTGLIRKTLYSSVTDIASHRSRITYLFSLNDLMDMQGVPEKKRSFAVNCQKISNG